MSFWLAGKAFSRKARKVAKKVHEFRQATEQAGKPPKEIRRQRRRQWLLPPLAHSSKYTGKFVTGNSFEDLCDRA